MYGAHACSGEKNAITKTVDEKAFEGNSTVPIDIDNILINERLLTGCRKEQDGGHPYGPFRRNNDVAGCADDPLVEG